MNILFLSSWFPYPADNGSKIRVHQLLRALGRRHDVTLVSFAFGTAQPEHLAPEALSCREIQVVRDTPFERPPLRRALRFFSPSPVVDKPIPEMTRLVSDTLARDRFDVVIASTTTTAAYALMSDHTRKVLEEHNSLSRWAFERYRAQAHPIGRLRGWVNWRKRLRYESRLYRCFDLCTMVSELDREATVRLLPHRSCCVVVVPNGIDCQHNRPSMSRSQANTLVFNGSLTYSANYDAMQMFLSQIYPRIRIEVPDVTLTITGSSCGVDLAGLCLDESVHLSGHVDDVRPLVAGAQACVVPLRQGGGTRLKILEAMALGTPVIATSKGAEGLEVVDGTHLLLADEPLDFSQRVVQILQEPALSEFLATNARRLVERHYDWEQIGQRFVALVEAAGACRDP